MKKRTLILTILAIVLVILAVAVLAACDKKPGGDTPITPVYEVTDGTKAVHQALKDAVALQNATACYVAFEYVVDKGADQYNVVYDLAAVVDFDDAKLSYDQLTQGLGKSKLNFRIYTDQQSKSILSVNYVNGNLYVNYPNTLSNATLRQIPLAAVAQYLHTSAYSADGNLRGVLDVLPDLFNRLFAACEFSQDAEAGTETYTFDINAESLQLGLGFLTSYTSDFVSSTELYALLGLDGATLPTDKLQMQFVLKTAGESKSLSKVNVIKTIGETMYTDTLQSFTCVALNANTLPQYTSRVTTADNLGSLYTYYHPANLDLKGTLTLDVKAASTYLNIWGHNDYASLSTDKLDFTFTLKSNYTVDGRYTLFATLTPQEGAKNTVALYYADGTLYINLDSMGLGMWQMPVSRLEDILSKIGGTYSAQTLSAEQIRDVLLDAIADRTQENGVTTYRLSGAHTELLTQALQNKVLGDALHLSSPLSLGSLTLSLTDVNNKFASVEARLASSGLDVVLHADDPKIGKAVSLDTPAWLGDCADPQQQERFTFTATGTLGSYTDMVLNTPLLESFLSSVSGEDVDLGEIEIESYRAAVSVSNTGALEAFMIDFLSLDGSLICSVYHRSDAADKIFLLDAAGNVRALSMRMDGRYVDFLADITPDATVTNRNNNVEIRNGRRDGNPYVLVDWTATGFGTLLNVIHEALPDLSYVSLPAAAGIQSVRLTAGEGAGIRVMFGGSAYVDIGLDSFGISDFALGLDSRLPSANVSLFEANNLPDRIDVTTVYADGTPRSMTVVLADVGTQWQYDSKPGLMTGANTTVSVHATCSILGQTISKLLYVDCAAPNSYTLPGGQEYAQYLAGKQFTFDRYTDQEALAGTMAAFSQISIRTGDKESVHALQWTHGGRAFALADWSRPDSTEGVNWYYKLIPNVMGFFGDMIPLTSEADAYTLCLQGALISGVKDANDLVSIAAYNGQCDPFVSETYSAAMTAKYGSRVPEFYDKDTNAVAVDSVYWDVDSIDCLDSSAGGVRYDNKLIATRDVLIEKLDSQLYALSGKYKINVVVADSLGNRSSLAVRVAVSPRIVQSITFDAVDLADGVQYAQGNFAIGAGQYSSLRANFALARRVWVTFEGDSTPQRFVAKDWTITAIDSINMFVPYEGNAYLSIGDEVGGKQRQTMTFSIANYPVLSLALWGYDKGGHKALLQDSSVAATASTKEVTFDLTKSLAQNPYDYIYPKGLAIVGDDSTNYIDYEWAFAGWKESELWNSDAIYTATADIYNLAVTVHLQFERKVATAWTFVYDYVEDENGDWAKLNDAYIAYDEDNIIHQLLFDKRYSRVNDIVASVPIYEIDPAGAWVVADGQYVPYDSTVVAHSGLQRYSLTNAQYQVAYRETAKNTWRLVMDPNKIDPKLVSSYPTQVDVMFADGTAARLDAVWVLPDALKNLSVAQSYKGTVGLSLAMNQPLANVLMSVESVSYANKYVTVSTDEQGNITSGKGDITMSVVATKAGTTGTTLHFNDLTSTDYIHKLICGCDDPDCLGKVYFVYEDGDNEDCAFSITEWRYLDRISALFDGRSVEKVAGDVIVVAVANNIECEVTVHVVATPLLAVDFEQSGMPLAASSLSTGGQTAYSMTAIANPKAGCVLGLTVDPYLADVRKETSYPTRLTLNIGTGDAVYTISHWALDGIPTGVMPYQGFETEIACILDTPMGALRLPVQLSVKRRIVQTLLVDGQETRVLYVDAYSNTPFGSNLVTIGDRVYANKSVGVQFENDDLIYNMAMRYDITDVVAPYAADRLADALSVEVGNAAGGYQSLAGYYLYSTANQVLRISVDMQSLDATSEAYLALTAYFGGGWDGVVYRDGTFATFADTEAGNAAWRALTVLVGRLNLECGYHVESEYVLYDSQNEAHDDLDRYRLESYGYTPQANGNYVFVGGVWEPYDAGSLSHRGLQRYSYKAATFEANAGGNYVLYLDTFVPYDSGNASMAGMARYNVLDADSNMYYQSEAGTYVYANGAFVDDSTHNAAYAGYMRFASAQSNTFSFVPDEGGRYVYVEGVYTQYDATKESHLGKTHYSLVADSPNVFVVSQYGSYVYEGSKMITYLADKESHQSLTRYEAVDYRYVADDNGAYVYTRAKDVCRTFVALESRNGNGVMYRWVRLDRAEGDVVALEVWNNNMLFETHLATEQQINTGMSRYIVIAPSMLTTSALDAITEADVATLTYSQQTVRQFVATYCATNVHAEVFGLDQVTYAIYRKGEQVALGQNDVLHAGNYTLRVGVNNTLYGGYYEVAVTVEPATVPEVYVTISGETRPLSDLAAEGFDVPSLTGLSAMAGDVGIDITYWAGDTQLNSMPYQQGEYTIRLASTNPDYKLAYDNFNLRLGQ